MFVDAGGLTMHVQVRGPTTAPVLFLLHSIGTSLHLWDAQADALAGRYRVVQMDLRGHGLTAVPRGPYSVEQLAADVGAAMDALDIERAHLAGVSLGGAVALAFASRAPGRVSSLVLCDTAASFPPAAFWRERARAVRADGLEPLVEPALQRWVTAALIDAPEGDGLRAMLRRTDPEGYAAAAEALAACDLHRDAAALRVETLVLVGELDASTPVATAEALSAAIPGAVLRVLPGLAHLPPMERPLKLTEALGGFLDGVVRRDSPSTHPCHR